MPIDESYMVKEYRYRCIHCGRLFTSGGGYAARAVRECEATCEEKAKEDLVHVFLPPPGRWDTMFQDSKWCFLSQKDIRVVCAKIGHDEETYWDTVYTNVDSHEVTEEECVRCKRCGTTSIPPQHSPHTTSPSFVTTWNSSSPSRTASRW